MVESVLEFSNQAAARREYEGGDRINFDEFNINFALFSIIFFYMGLFIKEPSSLLINKFSCTVNDVMYAFS